MRYAIEFEEGRFAAEVGDGYEIVATLETAAMYESHEAAERALVILCDAAIFGTAMREAGHVIEVEKRMLEDKPLPKAGASQVPKKTGIGPA